MAQLSAQQRQQGLSTQIRRIMTINELTTITADGVEAARSTLVVDAA